MLRRAVVGVLAIVGFAVAVFAQDDVVMTHSAAYNAAMDAGDAVAADMHGEAAWRAAEEAWGGAQQTGVLALNLATLRVTEGDLAEALEPARRALELAEDGVLNGVAQALDVELLVALAEVGSGHHRRARSRLRSTLR